MHTHDVQLMILDVMMPRMDGLSATMQIRKEKNVPILLPASYTHLDVYKRQSPSTTV